MAIDTLVPMYVPPQFVEDDIVAAVALVRTAGFGHLVVDTASLDCTPVPLLISDDGMTVRGHLARPNGVWRAAPCRALLIVPVTDAYVSPNWYPAKAIDGKVVPTWNYEVVHLRGRLEAHDDPQWITDQIRDLTDANESGRPQPWSVDDAPADYVDRMVRAIVGIELHVEEIVAKRKLSQNREQADRDGALAGLAASGDRGAAAVAQAMQRLAAEHE